MKNFGVNSMAIQSLMSGVAAGFYHSTRGVAVLASSVCAGIAMKTLFQPDLVQAGKPCEPQTSSAPVLVNPTPDQSIGVGQPFHLTVNVRDVFNDPDPGDSMSLVVTLEDGSPLPSWLTFEMKVNQLGVLDSEWALSVTHHDGVVYLADNDWGTRLIDVSDKQNPILMQTWEPYHVNADLACDNDVLYALCGCVPTSTGLQLLDISNPPVRTLIGSTNKDGSVLFKSGNLVYTGLDIIDVSSAATPSKVGEFTHSNTEDIVVINDVAYIAGGPHGFLVYDVSTPATPVLLSQIDIPGDGNEMGIDVRGNHAFVSTWNDYYVYDIQNPSSPVLIGNLPTSSNCLSVVGDNAFVGSSSGIYVINMQNFSSPIDEGFIPTSNVRDITVHDTVAYVADLHEGLKIVDLAERTFFGYPGRIDEGTINIKLTAKDLAGNAAEDIFALNVFGTPGTHPYPANSSPTVANPVPNQIVGADQPFNLQLNVRDVFNDPDIGDSLSMVATLQDGSPLPSWLTFELDAENLGSFDAGGRARNIDYKDNVVYIADSDLGVLLIDVSDKQNPTLITTWEPDPAYNVLVSGDILYTMCSSCTPSSTGFQLLDISNLPVRTMLGSTSRDSREMFKLDHLVYTGFEIIDVADPAAPFEIGELDISLTDNLVVANHIAHFAAGSHGYHTVDISNPRDSILLSTITTPGSTTGIDIRGHHVFVTTTRDLYIYDSQNPSNPVLLGTVEMDTTAGSPTSLFVIGDYAFAGTGNGIKVVNIEDFANPVYKGLIPTDNVYDIHFDNTFAYVADYYDGLKILDLGRSRFSGSPGDADEGTLNIKLIAKDKAGNTAEDLFRIDVLSSGFATAVQTASPDGNTPLPSPSNDGISSSEDSASDPTSLLDTLESIYSNRTYQMIGGGVLAAAIVGGCVKHYRKRNNRNQQHNPANDYPLDTRSNYNNQDAWGAGTELDGRDAYLD